MGERVIAKFTVVRKQPWTAGGGEVNLTPVYSEDPNHKNKKFWDATPSGSIQMCINNPVAFDRFEEGAEYYVEFTKAE
ncbi:MAG: hypothetical protein M0T69_02035 [Deltaproteobacteria bacterium]|nr:hypothetical protein [Deltaproteobacteria bacterium]